MIGKVRLMYICIPVAVSAFAAYGPVHILFYNLLLTPIFLRRKEDLLTPALAFIAAILSYLFISGQIPILVETRTPIETTLAWTDSVKIDGGTMKGFATLASGEDVYASFKFENEEQKKKFQKIHIPSYIFTVHGTFKDLPPAAHDYSFDMRKYLKMNGAVGMFEASELISYEENEGLMTILSAHRWRVLQHIRKTFPDSLAAEAEALLIGDRSGMEEDVADSYRTLGITHLFAISGLHVGLLTFMLRNLMIRLSIRIDTVDNLLMILLPLYAVIAGGAPSVWRAVSVAVLILLSSSGRYKLRMDDAVAASAIGFILWQPYVIFQPGFQLSYMAAISLIYSARILSVAPSGIAVSFKVTAITQLALYPVLLHHFFEVSLSSFVVNLLYVPLYSVVILPMNIILLAISYVMPPLLKIAFFFYEPFRNWIGDWTAWLASLPYQVWNPGKPFPLLLAIAVGGAFLFFIAIEKGKKLRYSVPIVIVPALLLQLHPYLESELRVTYLDVGQGDSIVIELPHRLGVYVIDTGGTVRFGSPDWRTPAEEFEVGRKIVIPYLLGRGITKVDKMF